MGLGRLVVIGLAALTWLPTVVAAAAPVATLGPITLAGADLDRLQLGLGAFDFRSDDDVAAVANLEYRFGRKLLGIGPALGLLASTDGALYGYGGIYADLSWGPMVVTPLLAVGGYAEGGSKDLGGTFEFRQSLDIAWQFDRGWRLGLRVAHISNANIHEINPGENELQLALALPLGPYP